MRMKVVVHEAEEGEYWAEVPAIPGCCTQGGRSGPATPGLSPIGAQRHCPE
jgi:hypothetical protein